VLTELTGPTGDALPADEVAQLITKLTEAKNSYRGGDTCGAAALLGEYETLAQGFRQGSMQNILFVGGYERFYNAGRLLRYDMIASTSMKDLCPGQERVGVVADAIMDETQTDNTQVIASASFGEPKFITVEANGDVFTQLDIPGLGGVTDGLGAPAVPLMRRLIAVPTGAEVSLIIDPQTAETIYVNLIPLQLGPIVDPLPPLDPSTFAAPPFVKDDAAYQLDQFLPENPCVVTDLGQIRDLRVFLIEWNAGQYNALTNELRLFNQIDVQVKFTGGDGTFLTEDSLNPFEISPTNYFNAVLNGKKIPQYIGKPHIRPNLGEEFMILTPLAYETEAFRLADWKNEKGIVTKVFEVGPGTPYLTKGAILGLIKSEYDNARTRPSYVLLFGDVWSIPTYYLDRNRDADSGPWIATDYPYASFAGEDQVIKYPFVALGRIPVRRLMDAHIVVDKIIGYEETPPGFDHQSFYENAAIASLFQCCRTDGVSPGTDQVEAIENSEFAHDVLAGAGYTVQRIYTETLDSAYTGDATPWRYSDGALLPSDLVAGSGFAWNGSESDVIGAFNAGKFLFIAYQHSSPGGWGNSPFTSNDAGYLSNHGMLPVVFSMGCASGFFDWETAGGVLGTTADGYYFAEMMLINSIGGTVGMLAPSRNTWSWETSALLRGFIDAIWPRSIPGYGSFPATRRLGDILNYGKYYLITQQKTGGITWSTIEDEVRMWHCLGDPTLEMWTKNPHAFSLPNTIAAIPGLAALAVQYDAPGATITAVQKGPNDELIPIARGVVGQDGTANLAYVERPFPSTPIKYVANLPDTVTSMTLTVQGEIIPGEMVSVPAGTFTMGNSGVGDDAAYADASELPRHQVTLSAYDIGKFDVTNQEYADILNWALALGYVKNASGAAYEPGEVYAANQLLIYVWSYDTCQITYSDGQFSPKSRTGLPGTTSYSMASHPVTFVTWFGAAMYCNWLSESQGLTPCYDTSTWTCNFAANGYHLPTSAQWERAAAWDGSKHWIYGFMSDTLSGKDRCNYRDSPYASPNNVNPLGLTDGAPTSPVGWFNGLNVSPNGSIATVDSPSPVGCYDMSGNVEQWCNDWFEMYSSADATDPQGPASGTYRVLHGGHWNIASGLATPTTCRTSRRNWDVPDITGGARGLRVVRTP
jgi:formylglycine-generating enzyme required for sulfatase activity